MSDYWNVDAYQKKDVQFQYVVKPSDDETQGATAANQQKNESVVPAPQQKQVDGFDKTVNGEQTAEQKNDASKRKESQNNEMQNTAFFSKVQTKIGSDEDLYRNQNAQLNQMIDAVNHGRYEEAAAKYEMLKQSGVLDGITDKPPFLDEMKSETANKKELEADVERARNSVNSNDGVDKMIEYYKAHDTKEKLHEAYDDKLKELGGSELHGARKMARANKKNLKSLEKQQALEDEGVVVGDKKAYKKARKEAENKDAVSYMSEGGMNVAQKINEALLKQGKPTILKKDGTIDVDAAQEYARQRVSTAGDRADKNEIAELAKEFGVSKKDVKAFFKGINVDYQKNYTIPGIAAGVVAGTATLLNPLAGATVGAVAGATNVYTDVTTTNTIEKSSILNGDQVEESIKNKSETTTNVRKEEVPGSSGHRRLGFGDFLGAAATGVAVEELVRKVVNHDSQILKKNKTIENVLSDKPEKVVRKKSNQDKVRLIQGYDLSAKGYDKETADQIKLALLSDAMGKGGKLNSRELNGVLAQLEAVPAKPKAQTPPPGEQTPPPTQTVTNVTLIDLGNNGFVNVDNGNKLTGDDGKTPLTSITGDDGTTIVAEGAKGSAFDAERLKHYNLNPANHPDEKLAPAQAIVAPKISDIEKDSSLSGIEAYKYPQSMPFTDSTNANDKGKTSNTYRFEKLPVGSPLIPKGEDGQPLQGVFYHIVSAQDDATGKNIKGNHEEVYLLEEVNISKDRIVSKKDSNGNITNYTIPKFDYHMHQYKGYAGSNQSVGDYVNDQNPNYKVNKGKTHKTRRR